MRRGYAAAMVGMRRGYAAAPPCSPLTSKYQLYYINMYVLGEGASLGGMRRGYAAGAADQREPKRPPGAKRGMRRVCAGGMRRPHPSHLRLPPGRPWPPPGRPPALPSEANRVCAEGMRRIYIYIYIYIYTKIHELFLITEGVCAEGRRRIYIYEKLTGFNINLARLI